MEVVNEIIDRGENLNISPNFPYNETKVPDTKVSSFKREEKKGKSELIRERLEYFLSENIEFKIRELSREFNCSPSLIEKCLKVVIKKYTNLSTISKRGRYGSVSFKIISLNSEVLSQKEYPIVRLDGDGLNGEHSNKGKDLYKGEHFSTISPSTIPQSKYSNKREHSNNGKHLFSLSQPTTPKSEQSFKGKHLKKEKEKVSYNLLKEIEKNKEKNSIEKIINNFLSFQEIENLDLFKYHKEILKTYLKYGGKIQEKDVKYGKGILTFATPKQFEAILLKVIREKKGEIPRIQYLYEVARRMNLKWKEKKENPKLFERKKENYMDGEGEITCEASFRGKTGDEAIREFFGEEVYQNMLKEREEEKRLKQMEEEKRLNSIASLTPNCEVKELE